MYWIWTSIGWPILSVFHFYYSQKHTLSVYNRVWEETWFVIDWWTWYLKFCSFLIKLGTCIPVFFWVVVLRSLNLLRCKIIFVESFCRVEKYGFLFFEMIYDDLCSLSLSGKIIYPFADLFVVQWKQLTEKYPKAKYYGILVWVWLYDNHICKFYTIFLLFIMYFMFLFIPNLQMKSFVISNSSHYIIL